MTFCEAFRVINENNKRIQELSEPKYDSQPYFVDKTFEKIKKLFKKAISDINERLEQYKKHDQTLQQPKASDTAPTVKKPEDDNLNGNQNNDAESSNGMGKMADELEDSFPADHSGDSEPNLLTILYEELMDSMAATKFACIGNSNGFITANLENLNALWVEFRAAYIQALTNKEKIEFSYSSVQMKYMKTTGH